MNKETKLRVWHKKQKRFCHAEIWVGESYMSFEEQAGNKIVFERFTGLHDKNNKNVYEGDIVKFKYHVGDFAWEFMSEEEAEWQRTEIGKVYVGVIEKDILTTNLTFAVRKPLASDVPTTTSYYQLQYAGGIDAEVIGNIHENPELLT